MFPRSTPSPVLNCSRQPLSGQQYVLPLRLMQSDSLSRAVYFPPPLYSLYYLVVGRVRNNCQEFQRPFLQGRLFTDQGKGRINRRQRLNPVREGKALKANLQTERWVNGFPFFWDMIKIPWK